jgi:hypothetical protein
MCYVVSGNTLRGYVKGLDFISRGFGVHTPH